MSQSAIEAEPLSTKTRILDSAEALFAERGFDGVSLRQITSAASVELALANYHFGPKTDLLLAVVKRRASELNAARMALLNALPANASLEAMIDAFARPFLEKSARGGAGWKSYARLIAQLANSPRWSQIVMSAEFDPVGQAFVARARCALPKADEREVYWGFHFVVGALTMTFAETGRIDLLSRGLCRSTELDEVYARMVPFLAAGFRAIAK